MNLLEALQFILDEEKQNQKKKTQEENKKTIIFKVPRNREELDSVIKEKSNTDLDDLKRKAIFKSFINSKEEKSSCNCDCDCSSKKENNKEEYDFSFAESNERQRIKSELRKKYMNKFIYDFSKIMNEIESERERLRSNNNENTSNIENEIEKNDDVEVDYNKPMSEYAEKFINNLLESKNLNKEENNINEKQEFNNIEDIEVDYNKPMSEYAEKYFKENGIKELNNEENKGNIDIAFIKENGEDVESIHITKYSQDKKYKKEVIIRMKGKEIIYKNVVKVYFL